MKDEADRILEAARRQGELLLAAEALCLARPRAGSAFRPCLSVLLALLLTVIPGGCSALLG